MALAVVCAAAGSPAQAQSVDYGGYRPHYQGYGVNTRAGRGGTVHRVTHLNDTVDTKSPNWEGSFRKAATASGARFVIFEVSGTINLVTNVIISSPFLTIAGQTAPSPGILIRGGYLQLDTHDVVIQHLRVRPGAIPGHPQGIWIRSNANNIVIDHVSVSWTVWTAIGLYAPSDPAIAGVGDVTIIDSMVSEALVCSGVNTNFPCDPATYPAPPNVPHSRAFLVGDANNNTTYNNSIPRLAMIRNISAHNHDRHPMVQGDVHLFYVNNLIYNPSLTIMAGLYWTNGYNHGPSFTVARGNLLIPGPTTPGHNGFVAPMYASEGDVYWGRIGSTVDAGTRIYLEGNYYAKHCPSNTCLTSTAAQWSLVRNLSPVPVSTLRAAAPPISLSNLPLSSAMPYTQVESYVVANAGARPLDRDPVDARIMRDIRNRTGKPINTPSDVGGYPTLAQNRRTLTVPTDPHGVADGVGRTRIELWLEQMARALEPARSDSGGPTAPVNVRVVP
jgi:hypothetical protein